MICHSQWFQYGTFWNWLCRVTFTFVNPTIIVISIRQLRKVVPIIIAMYWYVQYSGVTVKGMLDAVAMVNVPIKNHHLPNIMFGLGIFGCYGYSVEEAESTSLVLFSMMSWRPDKGKATWHLCNEWENLTVRIQFYLLLDVWVLYLTLPA